MKILLCTICTIVLLSGCDNDQSSKSTDRDNTGVNQRDTNDDKQTSFDQSNSQADTELVANLRSSILEIDDLSINGRNIKIITNEGRVVLRGPVDSAAERDAIEKVAKEVAGADNVKSELEVEND
jgi:hyperosmotically inducible periplasmic protein